MELIEIGIKNIVKIGERCFCDSGVKTANLYGSKVEINKDCFKNLQSIESVSIASNIIELEKATEIHYFKNSFNEMDIEECLHHRPTIKMKVLESIEKIKDDKCIIF